MKKHCGEAIREFELHNKQTTEQLYTLGQSLSRSFYCRAYNYGLMHTHIIHCAEEYNVNRTWNCIGKKTANFILKNFIWFYLER